MDAEELLSVVDSSLSQIKWRLKNSSMRRLQTDILVLCTGMRPVIMVDYGGKMPELGDRLCAFLKQCKKESSIFELLRVMVIDDMVYLIQVTELANFVKSSLSLESEMLFVSLENDPPKMMTREDSNPAVVEFLSAQKLFSLFFHVDGPVTSESPEVVDLSYCLQKSQVTIPTLNGWLLGYPVVYLFGKDFIEPAIYNLSTKSLHVYQIFVDRVVPSSKGYQEEELTSFTVPYELSLEGSNEPWAKAFLSHIREKWDKCKHVWGSLRMEVNGCYPQAIAL